MGKLVITDGDVMTSASYFSDTTPDGTSDSDNEQTTQAETGTAQTETSTATTTYTVTKGDSLWRIAYSQLGDGARYTEIMALSGLSSSTIYTGQVLTLPAE